MVSSKPHKESTAGAFARGVVIAAATIGVLPALSAVGGQEIPRTPSGRPDFTGNYDISTLTPWQRSPELGDRRAYNEEELERILGRSAAFEASKYAPSDPDRQAPAPHPCP